MIKAGQKQKEIFILGQSISLHYGKYLQDFLGRNYIYSHKTGKEEALKDYPELQQENGGDSAMVLQYLELTKDSLHPDILVFGAGLHDIRRDKIKNQVQIPLAQYKQNLKKIIALYRSHVENIVWMTTTSFDELTHNERANRFFRLLRDSIAYHEVAIEVMRESNIPIIDLRSFTESLGSEDKFIDHIHFSKKVRKDQAKFVSDWIKDFASCS